jgi:hypothetical protein
MTNEFSGHIACRLSCIAALEHENHKNNHALRVLPCSATNPTYSLHLKTHPSWVYNRSTSDAHRLWYARLPFCSVLFVC